jgi:S-adenosyl methyltransferase
MPRNVLPGPASFSMVSASPRPVFDPHAPNVARIYNYLLDGKDHYAADRVAAEMLLRAVPEAAVAARQNRSFLGRAVEFLARDCGIEQFIDIGMGLPAQGSVHEVAWRFAAGAPVVYADNDPAVVLHAETLLSGHAAVEVISADLRDPDRILDHPSLRRLIDLDQPVAVLLVAVLHFIEDASHPYLIVDCLKEAMAPGSYLVISHVTADNLSAGAAGQARAAYEQANAPGVTRTREQITRFFDGLDVIPPGVVSAASWRAPLPLRGGRRTIFHAGTACKTTSRDSGTSG